LDSSAKEVIQPIYLNYSYGGQYVAFKSVDGWELFGRNGMKLVPYKFEEIEYVGLEHLNVKQAGKWGLLSLDGRKNSMVIPAKYSRIDLLENNALAVSDRGLFGVFDTTGKEILPMIYKDITALKKAYYALDRPSVVERILQFRNSSGTNSAIPQFNRWFQFYGGNRSNVDLR